MRGEVISPISPKVYVFKVRRFDYKLKVSQKQILKIDFITYKDLLYKLHSISCNELRWKRIRKKKEC